MITIDAKGDKDGNQIDVHVDVIDSDARFIFNGKSDYQLEAQIMTRLGKPIGGTYYPKTLPLQIVAVLSGYFYDTGADELHVGGDETIETIPFKEGVIY